MIIRSDNNFPFFRGFLATVLRDCPAFGIYFASYDWMARKMSKDGKMESLTTPQLLFAGGQSPYHINRVEKLSFKVERVCYRGYSTIQPMSSRPDFR